MLVKAKNVSWNLSQLKAMIEEQDTIRFDHPIQRASDQWNASQKELWVDSLVNCFPVPPIYFLRIFEIRENEKKPTAVRETLDGQQRLTVTISFLNDAFSFSKDIAPISLSGESYEIAGKFFSELDEAVQAHIMARTILTYTLDEEETTEEQIEEVFRRLNNSKGLSPHQKTKSIMGTKFARLINAVKEHELIKQYGNFPANSIKNDEHQTAILQAMMLIENYDYKKFSTAEVTKYAKTIRSDFEGKALILEKVEKAFDYLVEAFDTKQKLLLKKINFPTTIYLANKALEQEIDSSLFAIWAVAFEDAVNGEVTNIPTNYLEYTGVGSTDLAKVKGRLNEMERHFNEYTSLMHSTV